MTHPTPTRPPKIVPAAAALVLLLTGCQSKLTEPYNDAPRASLNDKPADVLSFPDGFNNVAAKCDGPNRVYVVFHKDSPYGSVAVVANDPRCSGGPR